MEQVNLRAKQVGRFDPIVQACSLNAVSNELSSTGVYTARLRTGGICSQWGIPIGVVVYRQRPIRLGLYQTV